MFNKKYKELIKIVERVEKVIESIGGFVTCDTCGVRVLREKAIKGKDVIRKIGAILIEKYIYTPYYCIHCKKK